MSSRTRRRVAYWSAVALALAAIGVGTGTALSATNSGRAPADVVREYFAALARADAPAALALGEVPPGDRRWLTRAVLARQLAAARIARVRIVAVTPTPGGARVRYAYRLERPDGARSAAGNVDLIDGADGWRLTRVAEPVRIVAVAAADRAALAGSRLPGATRPVLLFPGALPVSYASPWLTASSRTRDVRITRGVSTVRLGAVPTAAARRTMAGELVHRLTGCFDGSATERCPLPPPGVVPGSVRGRIVTPHLTVVVEPDPAGLLAVRGSVRVQGTWQRLDVQDVARPRHGVLTLDVSAVAWARSPLVAHLAAAG